MKKPPTADLRHHINLPEGYILECHPLFVGQVRQGGKSHFNGIFKFWIDSICQMAPREFQNYFPQSINLWVPEQISSIVLSLACPNPILQLRVFGENALDFGTLKAGGLDGSTSDALKETGHILFIQRKILIAFFTSTHNGQILWIRLIQQDLRWDVIARLWFSTAIDTHAG
jgi:hypothetical protein